MLVMGLENRNWRVLPYLLDTSSQATSYEERQSINDMCKVYIGMAIAHLELDVGVEGMGTIHDELK